MKKYEWLQKPINADLLSSIQSTFDFSDDFCRLLATRGFENVQDIQNYFSDNQVAKPEESSVEFQKALEKIFEKIKENQFIVIHGDYDVDGISATSILFDFIYYKLDYKNVIPYIPSRLDEGYGISEGSLESILELLSTKKLVNSDESLPLLISVDCGVKETSLIDDKWYKVFDFIITDHHSLKIENDEIKTSKKAIAIIHPKLLEFSFQEICGTVVIFKLIEYIIHKENFDKEIMDEYFPFLALATNCDVMPLVNENRLIMKRGLELFREQKNLGLRSLVNITKLENLDITPYHLGYVLGPHINAAGRIGNALDAVKLFVSRDEKLVDSLAQKLSALNSTRQSITVQRMALAEVEAESQVGLGNKIIVVVGDKWEDGIIGLIAGKLCEKYHLPTIVISVGEDEAVGSCRSLSGINITEILGKHAKLLLRYGGHTQAAGLRLEVKNVAKFQKVITKYCNENLESDELKRKITIDLELVQELSEDFWNELCLLEPHGMGNAKPNLLLKNCEIKSANPLGKDGKHLKIVINKENSDLVVVGFNVDPNLFQLKSGDLVDMVGNLDLNEFNGNCTLQLILKDLHLKE